MREPVTAYLGLGANLGNGPETLHWAVQQLGNIPGVVLGTMSSLYQSAPIESSGPDYTNAALQVHTILTAPALLHRLHAIEALAGRERPYRNAPRTLDLDLLLFGDGQINSPSLTIPHPRMHLRAFVLLPLAEIAPHLVRSEDVEAVHDQGIVHLPSET